MIESKQNSFQIHKCQITDPNQITNQSKSTRLLKNNSNQFFITNLFKLVWFGWVDRFDSLGAHPYSVGCRHCPHKNQMKYKIKQGQSPNLKTWLLLSRGQKLRFTCHHSSQVTFEFRFNIFFFFPLFLYYYYYYYYYGFTFHFIL